MGVFCPNFKSSLLPRAPYVVYTDRKGVRVPVTINMHEWTSKELKLDIGLSRYVVDRGVASVSSYR